MDMCNFVSKIKLDLIDWDCLMFVLAYLLTLLYIVNIVMH
jgi:hypothetical protein